MEQKSLDHCLVIRGIPEGPNEGERECVDKIYVELSNTIESTEEKDQIIMACRMEIKRAHRKINATTPNTVDLCLLNLNTT